MQTPDKDGMDLWLDRALRQQANVEPTSGIEGRVLARVHSQRRNRTRAVLAWALSGVVVAGLLIVVFLRPAIQHAPKIQANNRPANAIRHEQIEAAPKALTRAINTLIPKPQIQNRPRPTSRAADNPRLAHFPSVRPLEPQEVALAQYAESYPKEAAIVAKDQEDFDLEIQKAQEEVDAGSAISNQ